MTIDADLVWNQWIGYTKPLMDFRNDAPMPSPPNDPAANPDDCFESFWSSCVQNTQVVRAVGIDAAIVVLPESALDLAVVFAEPPAFDAEVILELPPP